MDNKGKADLFAQSFPEKHALCAAEVNEYTSIEPSPFSAQGSVPKTSEKDAADVLGDLKVDSGTGPDFLPSRILKSCSSSLAKPVQLSLLLILASGWWPECWTLHWVLPLHERKSVYQPSNYRGIHLTAQLSKVVERLLKKMIDPFISRIQAFGPQQYAYTIGRGARDALALLVLQWTQAIAFGFKVAVYCSDVSGAFDRVPAERLIAKLRSKKIHPVIVNVLSSWLRQRSSQVVVGGAYSQDMVLNNMVFQGTVNGPTLWNIYFEDARQAINEWLFNEVVFADDLNAFRVFPSTTNNASIDTAITNCQSELHKWGRANQVAFDAAKESRHILSLTEPAGDNFKLLGVEFDASLTMSDAVGDLVSAAGWKLRTLLRTRRYYSDADLITLYKSHVLSWLEYRTPALYHATRTLLQRLDEVQSRFLRDIGVDEVTALMEFNLAPLEVRRDIALLGMIHRAAIGDGPPQLRDFFKRRKGSMMISDPYENTSRPPLLKRTAWGLIPVYNKLGSGAQSINAVKDFQWYLQERVKTLIRKGFIDQWKDWRRVYSPR